MLYRLLCDDGSVECEGEAQDDDHALVVLGGKIEKRLAFDSPSPHTYQLQCVEKQVRWRSREGRAVYIID